VLVRAVAAAAQAPGETAPLDFDSALLQFDAYAASKREGIKNEGNLPFLRTHGYRTENVALLVHGLTDSPYYMKAVADILYDNDYNVLGILLAGHGTRPEDLLGVELEEWREDVDRGLAIADRLGDKITLAGFSTGGALVLDAVAKNRGRRESGADSRDLENLMLFSPAIKIKNIFVKHKCRVAGIVTHFRPYLQSNADAIVEDNPYKYRKMAINAVCQLQFLTEANARNRGNIIAELDENGVSVFAVQSEADGTVSAGAVKEFMDSLPPSIRREFILYPEAAGIQHSSVPRPELNPRFEALKGRLEEMILEDRTGSLEDAVSRGSQLYN